MLREQVENMLHIIISLTALVDFYEIYALLKLYPGLKKITVHQWE